MAELYVAFVLKLEELYVAFVLKLGPTALYDLVRRLAIA
jgi:hypothetical protein